MIVTPDTAADDPRPPALSPSPPAGPVIRRGRRRRRRRPATCPLCLMAAVSAVWARCDFCRVSDEELDRARIR